MIKKLRLVTSFLVICLTAEASAEVKQATPDGFLISFSEPVTATPTKAYAAITQPQNWWSSDHTWSGKAANLSLKPEAGGCFCERWKDGSVEHGRVIMALPDKLLRLDSALGPLQEFALKGILSFWIKTGDDGATLLNVEYRVDGASGSGLDAFAPQVDAVLGAQVARLARFIDSGNPDEPPVTENLPGQQNARAVILDDWAKSAAAAKAAANKTAAPKAPQPDAKKKTPDPADGP